MFLIDTAPPFVPGMCLVTKQGGEGPYVDLGRDFDYDHVGRMYIHHSAVRDMHSLLLTNPELAEMYGESDKDRELKEARQQIADLQAAFEAQQRELDAIYVLKNSGSFTAQKKPGRKPKKEPVTSGS